MIRPYEVLGVLEFPSVFGVQPGTAAIESLLISKKHGLRFGGQIRIEAVQLGAFTINKVLLKYIPDYSNPALDVFEGEGDLTTPAFQDVSANEQRLGVLKAELAVIATQIKGIQTTISALFRKVTAAVATLATNFFSLVGRTIGQEFRVINAGYNRAMLDAGEPVGAITYRPPFPR